MLSAEAKNDTQPHPIIVYLYHIVDIDRLYKAFK